MVLWDDATRRDMADLYSHDTYHSMHVLRHQREATLKTFLCHQFRPTTAVGQFQVAKSELEMHVSS